MGCPGEFIGLPALIACAAAIGNSRRVQLKNGWSEPSILWGAIVGPSGSLKSPALDLAVGPMRDLQREASEEHRDARDNFDEETIQYQEAIKQWREEKSGEKPPAKPKRPVMRRYVANDVTFEALASILHKALAVSCWSGMNSRAGSHPLTPIAAVVAATKRIGSRSTEGATSPWTAKRVMNAPL